VDLSRPSRCAASGTHDADLATNVTPMLQVGSVIADDGLAGPHTFLWEFYRPKRLATGDPVRYGFPERPVETGARLPWACR
jgi:hypothetical protein